MPNKLPRSTRIYIRRRKAELRRESDNPQAAIDALMRQFPRPTPPADAVGQPTTQRAARTPSVG